MKLTARTFPTVFFLAFLFLTVSSFDLFDDDRWAGQEQWWRDYRIGDFWRYLKCEELFEKPRPIHDESTWRVLWDSFHKITTPLAPSFVGPQPQGNASGFAVQHFVKQIPGKGRGIFASQFIPKGKLVYSTTKQTARFHNAHHYRTFLTSIPEDLTCDVLMWAYVQDLAMDGEEEKLVISLDMDDGSLCNDGDSMANIGCDSEAAEFVQYGCKLNYFALRDIEAGEELECMYGNFVPADGGWNAFGL
jgi:hypothetical protein